MQVFIITGWIIYEQKYSMVQLNLNRLGAFRVVCVCFVCYNYANNIITNLINNITIGHVGYNN